MVRAFGGVRAVDGASFEQTPVYQKHKGRILAVTPSAMVARS